MQQVLYIHGGNAYTEYENFLEDLRTKEIRDLPGAEKFELWSKKMAESLGGDFEVFAPMMPNKQNAKYEEWKIWFERYFEYLRDDAVLVGWSQGAYFLIKYLIENEPPFKVKTLFLLASPFETDDFGGEDGGDFAFDTTKVGEIAGKAGKVVIMHSEDDFVVPYSHALKLKGALPEAEFVSFTDRNHFLQEEFPELIEKIKKVSGGIR